MYLLEAFGQDARRGIRSLIRTPGFTMAASLTLALGIGASAAIFSIVDAVLLRPLPYADAASRVMIWSRWTSFDKTWVSDAEVLDYRKCASFARVGAWGMDAANLTGIDPPVRVTVGLVTANLFQALGARPALGRAFLPGEDVQGSDTARVVISHGLWQRAFGGDRHIIGKRVRLDEVPHEVVGVMPAGFQLPTDYNENAAEPTQAWVPLPLDPANRGSHGLYAVAQLAPRATVEMANAELQRLTTANVNAGLYPTAMRFQAFAVPLDQEILGTARTAVAVLVGAVAFLLLIACGNVANLLLARGEGRQREMALRIALGAGRWRLIRQLLTESLVLAVLGGLVGLGLALAASRLVARAQVEAIPRLADATIDARVTGFTLLVAALATILFGMAPAMRALRTDPVGSLKEGGRSLTGHARGRTRSVLVAGAVALSMILLVGASLMIRSLWSLYRIDPGFNPSGVLTLRLAPPETRYDEPGKTVLFYRTLLERVRGVPGVQHAGVVRSLPLAASIGDWGLDVEGFVETPGHNAKGDWQVVSDGAAEAMGERLVRGRLFQTADTTDSMPVAIVNEALARKYFQGRDALGGRIRMGSQPDRPWLTVVGIVADVKHNGLTGEVKEKFYVPHAQFHLAAARSALTGMSLVVRTAGDPVALAAPIREAVRGIDPNVPIAAVRSMEEVLAESIATQRFTGSLLVVFAALALTLAAVGVFGVLSYVVGQRTHEIGVRMAIGASRLDVMRLVISDGARMWVAGLAVGLLGAAWLSRTLNTLLHGVRPFDVGTFAVASCLLGLVALAASAVPAWRATSVDPLVALRDE